MRIIVIGSGNVATHLARAIYSKGESIAQIWSFSFDNAQILAEQVSAQPVKNLSEVDRNADLCILAVKDDAVKDVGEQLADFKGIIVHTSGAVPMNVFNGTFDNYGVFYPLQTFSKSKEVDFSNIPICIESNNVETSNFLEEFAKRLSVNVQEINSEKRKILHLAAVFACNFTNHLYALAGKILQDNELAFDLIRPLISETSSKVQHHLPLDVQTGPAVRNDIDTEQKHLQLLENTPQMQEIYKILSESIKKSR